MKRNNKLLSAIISAGLIACSISPALSGAADFGVSESDNDYQQMLSRMIQVDDAGMLDWAVYGVKKSQCYVSETGKSMYKIYDSQEPEIILVSLESPQNIEALNKLIEDFNSNNGTEIAVDSYNSSSTLYFPDSIVFPESTARALQNAFLETDYITEAVYYNDRKDIVEIRTDYPLTYENEKRESVEQYITENSIDCQLIELNDDMELSFLKKGFRIEITENNDVFSQMKLAVDIYKATGARITGLALMIKHTLNASSIDLLNSIEGDANCDEESNMADAVAIMQAYANPAKYSLTPQGSFNADIANTGDGVTLLDAQAIQKNLLRVD